MASEIRVLWFVNVLLPDMLAHYGRTQHGSGGWMGEELALLRQNAKLRFHVVCASQGRDDHFSVGGVDYYVVGMKKPIWSVVDPDARQCYLDRCSEIVNSVDPHLVHIHGTERFYCKLITTGRLTCPVIVSIQGLVEPYSEWYRWFGRLSLADIVRQNWLMTAMGRGLLWDLLNFRRRARRETAALRAAHFFLGRTDWDRAHVLLHNPSAAFFCAPRVIRGPFWERKWDISSANRHRLIFTNARHPRKGVDLILEAIEYLRNIYPDITLVLIGSLGAGGYGRSLRKRISGMDSRVITLGPQSAESVARELAASHAFVSASYIENSPNSVAEAQVVGMPVISTLTGGVGSMVRHDHNGLLFPTGEVALLIERVRTLFDDDDLAKRLGQCAYEDSRVRHDPIAIGKCLQRAYAAALD